MTSQLYPIMSLGSWGHCSLSDNGVTSPARQCQGQKQLSPSSSLQKNGRGSLLQFLVTRQTVGGCPTSFSTALPYFCNDGQKRELVGTNIAGDKFPLTGRNSCDYRDAEKSVISQAVGFHFPCSHPVKLLSGYPYGDWGSFLSILQKKRTVLSPKPDFISLCLGNDCPLPWQRLPVSCGS